MTNQEEQLTEDYTQSLRTIVKAQGVFRDAKSALRLCELEEKRLFEELVRARKEALKMNKKLYVLCVSSRSKRVTLYWNHFLHEFVEFLPNATRVQAEDRSNNLPLSAYYMEVEQ